MEIQDESFLISMMSKPTSDSNLSRDETGPDWLVTGTVRSKYTFNVHNNIFGIFLEVFVRFI
jgi:hypothetical protein